MKERAISAVNETCNILGKNKKIMTYHLILIKTELLVDFDFQYSLHLVHAKMVQKEVTNHNYNIFMVI